MPLSGFMVFYDGSNSETPNPSLVAPGWWAKFCTTIGSGNTSPGAEPGQGIILMPGMTQADYLAFPTRNSQQTQELYTALTLLKGLEQLGISPEDILGR